VILGGLAKHKIYEIEDGLLAKVKEKDGNEERKKQWIESKLNERERKHSV
jgi:hypothetical protein